jgi:hypothetical protein
LFCFVLFCFVFASRVFVFESSLEGGIREWPITAARVAILVIIVEARVTHQRESLGETRVARKVGAVIKSSITRDTQAVLVFIEIRHSLFAGQF